MTRIPYSNTFNALYSAFDGVKGDGLFAIFYQEQSNGYATLRCCDELVIQQTRCANLIGRSVELNYWRPLRTVSPALPDYRCRRNCSILLHGRVGALYGVSYTADAVPAMNSEISATIA